MAIFSLTVENTEVTEDFHHKVTKITKGAFTYQP